jgi:anti-sigma factor RsiW
MNTTSRFHLFSIITKCIRSFSDSKVRKKIGFCPEQAKNAALAHYINSRRKKEEDRRRPERRRRRRPRERRWWWRRRPMRAKAPRILGLGGSSPP